MSAPCTDGRGRLDEMRILLRYLDRPAADCGEVNAVLDEHIEQVARLVRELKLLEKQLRELRAHCNSERKGLPCGILEELSVDRHSADGSRRPSSGHGEAPMSAARGHRSRQRAKKCAKRRQ